MLKRKRLVAALCLNILIIALELIALYMNLRDIGWTSFIYYTQESNVVAMSACALMAVYQLQCLRGKRESAPRWAVVFKYAAVCLVSVTFLVVLFVLGPATGSLGGFVSMFLHGSMLYQHFLCPVLAFVSFVFFEDAQELRRGDALLALIPTVAYAVVFTMLNILRVLEGPYLFFMVYEQPVYMSVIWFILIDGGAYLIACLTRRIKNKADMRRAVAV